LQVNKKIKCCTLKEKEKKRKNSAGSA